MEKVNAFLSGVTVLKASGVVKPGVVTMKATACAFDANTWAA
ncbi:hypothetical protein [Nitrosomonas halophila]|nr:hypothetical protein [Nitrosomonas halophila]HRQ06473.1 hypothetical protein [Nitrosomonas halophila]